MQTTVRATLARLGITTISEDAVINGDGNVTDVAARVAVLAGDRAWVESAYGVLRGGLHSFRLLIARWSPLLIASDESVEVLAELGRQAAELAELYTALLPLVRERQEELTNTEKARFAQQWSHAFTNSICLDEALIRLGNERGIGWSSAARKLLPAVDRDELERRDRARGNPLRLHR